MAMVAPKANNALTSNIEEARMTSSGVDHPGSDWPKSGYRAGIGTGTGIGTGIGTGVGADLGADRVGDLLGRVQLPLSNAEFALEQYLLRNGQRLDTETRILLAGVRDCVRRAALNARRLSTGFEETPEPMSGKPVREVERAA